MSDYEYVVVVQCDIVTEWCPGFFCEQALFEKTDGFADLDQDKNYRATFISCGGCCGRALQRKVSRLLKLLQKKEGIAREKVAVQFSSCITHESHHGPVCPHLEYLKDLIHKLGLEVREGTHFSKTSARKREEGIYKQSQAD